MKTGHIFFRGGVFMKKNAEEKRRTAFSRTLADELQIPPVQILDDFHIEFFGRNQVLTEGCLGVLEYDSGRIRLNLSGADVTYEGCGLEISSYDDGRIEIKGRIENVSFSK